MPRRNRDVEATLLNKFHFERSPTRSDDHRWLQLKLPDLPPIITHFSHGRQEIGDVLWSLIAKQLRVRKKFLNEMIDCTKSRDDYYEQLRSDPLPLPGRSF
jgi:hypothetical protein